MAENIVRSALCRKVPSCFLHLFSHLPHLVCTAMLEQIQDMVDMAAANDAEERVDTSQLEGQLMRLEDTVVLMLHGDRCDRLEPGCVVKRVVHILCNCPVRVCGSSWCCRSLELYARVCLGM